MTDAVPASTHADLHTPSTSTVHGTSALDATNLGTPSAGDAQTSSRRASARGGAGRGARGRGRGRGGSISASRSNGNDAQLGPSDGSTPQVEGGGQDAGPSRATPSSRNGAGAGRGGKRSQGRRGGKAGQSGGTHTTVDGVDPQNSDQSHLQAPRRKQNGAPKPSASSRRKQFGGQLTGVADVDGEEASDAPAGAGPSGGKDKAAANGSKSVRRVKAKAIPTATPAGEHVEYADLRSRLLAELASGQYDCVVCYSTATTKQAVWSCSQCYTVLHLGCVRKWAEASVKKAEEQNAMQEDRAMRDKRGTWRCPGCQYAREDVPKVYWCWCGRIQDPTGGRGANPHGCGQRCNRGKCDHGCPDQCHPGPCPPCAVTVSQRCFCGSRDIPMRCSQTSSRGPSLSAVAEKGITCGDTCGRKLDCGVHTCEKTCHPGSCDPCSVQLDASCYCGKDTKQMRCGDGDKRTSQLEGRGTWVGLYRCDSPCGRLFACGVHACERPCHPQETQGATCPSSPDIVKTCPCGAIPAADRQTCQDPIPVCNNICSRPFPCGHACPATCHLGSCPPCSEPVAVPCRCGETKQTRPCFERQREESEGKQELLCDTVCKAMRHCGKHRCGGRCCPLFFQSKGGRRPPQAVLQAGDPAGFHDCSIPCVKPLACGKHDCPMTCHRGSCPPCLQATFEDVACHCGRTILEPPVPCGAKVICNFPCARPPPPCGHPAMPHNCHDDDEACPPCVYLTDKVCHCQKNIVKHVPCSRTRISCGQACEALLNCGYHRCQGICHVAPDECAPCSQVCGKPRKLCQHPCKEKCHAPSSCPETDPCEAIVTLQCACGNLQSRAKCGVSIHNPTKEKTLKCNDSCIIAERNAKLAEALGLNPAEKAAPAAYEHETLQFYSVPANRKFCEEVEATLNDFIRSPRAGMILPPANKLQRKFTHELAAVYKLATESLDSEPRRSVSVRRKQDSRIPKPLISEAFAAAKATLMATQMSGSKGSGGLAQLRRPGTEAPKPLNAVFLPGVFGHDQDSLRSLLQPVLKNIAFSVTWKGDEDVLVTSTDSPTRLIMMKTELKALVRRERFARDVVLCAADSTGRILRKEDEPALGVGAGASRPSSGSNTPSAWGSAMSRTATAGSGTATPRTAAAASLGNRGWAAVAAGSGRSSPVAAAADAWGGPTAANAGAAGPTAARVIPNPNAPQRSTGAPQPPQQPMSQPASAAQSPKMPESAIPESWEDDDDE
ncbi:related to Shuttle craft protein [Pseudozyma flocculosa]|uniref:Related to Shuttle craft protein n=1 Tax=Pseudozyma flocculosa TaxID=84751 RepID=A0A5C3EUM8_9BASI|nr:related to Shuttle craft protein [Pseudozyma flocculosa]